MNTYVVDREVTRVGVVLIAAIATPVEGDIAGSRDGNFILNHVVGDARAVGVVHPDEGDAVRGAVGEEGAVAGSDVAFRPVVGIEIAGEAGHTTAEVDEFVLVVAVGHFATVVINSGNADGRRAYIGGTTDADVLALDGRAGAILHYHAAPALHSGEGVGHEDGQRHTDEITGYAVADQIAVGGEVEVVGRAATAKVVADDEVAVDVGGTVGSELQGNVLVAFQLETLSRKSGRHTKQDHTGEPPQGGCVKFVHGLIGFWDADLWEIRRSLLLLAGWFFGSGVRADRVAQSAAMGCSSCRGLVSFKRLSRHSPRLSQLSFLAMLEMLLHPGVGADRVAQSAAMGCSSCRGLVSFKRLSRHSPGLSQLSFLAMLEMLPHPAG